MKFRITVIVIFLIVGVSIIGVRLWGSEKKGEKYWFGDHTFHFEAIRALAYAPFKAADVNEVMTVVSNITEGDLESWYTSWLEMAQLIETKAELYTGEYAKASALLRAANYYRSAAFFLHGDDARRKAIDEKRIASFEQGMDLMAVRRDNFEVPYQDKHLNAFLFHADGPFNSNRPLLMIINGFDGMYEEMYYMLGQAATQRGYNVLIYEGPGQGASISEKGLTFTPEWHIPNSLVLDAYIARYGKPSAIGLAGMSLGAWLGMEAIMYDKRFDAFIANDVLYSFRDTAQAGLPGIARWAYQNDHPRIYNFMVKQASKSDSMIKWAAAHAKWVMGEKDAFEVLKTLEPYHFSNEMLEKVTADILLMEGEADHMLKITDQMGRTLTGLKNAKSVMLLTFKNGEGGEEHCHMGALLQAQAGMLDWLDSKIKPAAAL